jgi:hypothetical protein
VVEPAARGRLCDLAIQYADNLQQAQSASQGRRMFRVAGEELGNRLGFPGNLAADVRGEDPF